MSNPSWLSAWDPKTVELVESIAKELGFDASWAKAIIQTESSGNPLATRYESNWKYFLDVKSYANYLRQTEETEKICQSMSWGLCQLMGSVAREHGYKGYLTKLIEPELNIRLGIVHMKRFKIRYPNGLDWVSSYNQGNPRRGDDLHYVNQVYVNRVLGYWQDLTGY